jgi:hypothetical protein
VNDDEKAEVYERGWRTGYADGYDDGYKAACKDTRTEQLRFEIVRPNDDDPYIQLQENLWGEVPF